jgi:hypothetical protein
MRGRLCLILRGRTDDKRRSWTYVRRSSAVGSPLHSCMIRVRENKAEATERSEVAGALGCGAQVDRGMGFHPPHLFRFSALQDLAVKRGAYPISQ